MKQKIIKVGNSLAVTIPSEFVRKTGYKAGDEVMVEHDTKNKMILVKDKGAEYNPQLTPEFFEWLNDVKKRYKKAIVELANK